MSTFVSLFTGVGGMDLGLEDAGWKCSAQVELDPDCQQVLALRWPKVPKWGDVREVSGGELPPADVVAFGSPCQGLSIAGQRAGLDHHESGLFLEAERIIRGMRGATGGAFPRVAIWENVVGALSSNGGADFEAVLGHLAECGALAIEWRVVDAAFFGVPQRRRRVFLVAVFDPRLAGAGEILADPEGVPGHPAAGEGAPYLHPAAAVGGVGADRGDDGRGVGQPGLAKALLTKTRFNPKEETFAWAENTRNELGGMNVAPTLNRAGGKAGRGYSAVVEPIGFNHIQDPISSDGRALPLGARDCGGAVLADIPRRLTPRERERLMGWPDDWTRWRNDGRENGDTTRNRMTGNGVVRPVAAWVGRRVSRIL